jgi:hypothetical protein
VSIKIKNITHLFWGKYPYKVTLTVPVPEIESPLWHHKIAATDKAIRETVKDRKGVKCRSEANTPSYFFMTLPEAEAFIKANHEIATTLFKPTSDEQIVQLADEKLRFRKSLYFNQYRWAVILKTTYREGAMDEADAWVEDYFDLDPGGDDIRFVSSERVRYNYYWTRAIYVNELADVIAAKIALSQYVKSTLCCVLPGEELP